MASTRLAPILAPALALAACGGTAEPVGEPPLAGAAIGGPFELVSEAGEATRWSDFDGDYRIVYFGYTYCPDICPVDVQRAMAGLEMFQEESPRLAAQVQPIFVTVDPERDTPAKLAEFTDAFHPRLIGLTGTPEAIADAANAFAVPYGRDESRQGDDYLVSHSGYTYLFGPQGEPIATLPTDQGPEAVAQELAKWVR